MLKVLLYLQWKPNDCPIPKLNCQGEKLITSLHLEEDCFVFCVGTEQFSSDIRSTSAGKVKVTLKAVGVHVVGTC